MIAAVEVRLRDRDMQIELTQAAKDLLAEKGFDPVLGARPLRRTVQREVEDVLAEKMLYGEVGAGQIVLVDGEFTGAINRKPGEGEFRSNLAQGGYAEAATLTEREEEICAAMGPELKKRGLVFVGIDVIGGKWLTEINVTSPTGIVAIDKFNGTDTAGRIWDAIDRRLGA